MNKAIMPAGTYYIGDLCYVISHHWDEVMGLIFPSHTIMADGQHTLKNGTQFAMYSTAYGDGEYFDYSRKAYGVDSGTLGCVPVSECNHPESQLDLGHVHTFPEPFMCYVNKGTVIFGTVCIETADMDDPEGDDTNWEEDDEQL